MRTAPEQIGPVYIDVQVFPCMSFRERDKGGFRRARESKATKRLDQMVGIDIQVVLT